LVKVLSKNIPAGSWALVATVNLGSSVPFDGDAIRIIRCELHNGAAIIGSAADRRVIPDDDSVLVSLSMNGGAAVPAGGGEVSLWCASQVGAQVQQAQMMIMQVGGFS
jgi:hypothetical protein